MKRCIAGALAVIMAASTSGIVHAQSTADVSNYGGDSRAITEYIDQNDVLIEFFDGRKEISAQNVYMDKAAETVIIEEGIEGIAADTFARLKNLQKIQIPDSVTKIDQDAFRGIADQVQIFTEKDSYAYQYAVENGMEVKTDQVFCVQSEDGSSAVVFADPAINAEKGTMLQVTITTEGEELDGLTKEIEKDAVLYDMAFTKDGEQVNIETDMRIYFTLPDEINCVFSDFYTVAADKTLMTKKVYPTQWGGRQKKGYMAKSLQRILAVTGHVDGDAANDFVIENGILTQYRCADSKVTVPDGIETIGERAFHFLENVGNWNVKHVVLPEGVKKIEREAFFRGSIHSIVLPDSMEIIEKDAFAYEPVEPDEPPAPREPMPITIYGKTLSVAESYATENGDVFYPTNEQLLGDVNGNGIYEAEDALGILRMVVKLDTVYGYSADADGDKKVSAADALKVLKKVVGL